MKDKHLELLLGEDVAQQADALETMYGVEFALCTHLRRSRMCEVFAFRGSDAVQSSTFKEAEADKFVGWMVDRICERIGESRSSLKMKMQIRGLA